MNCADFIRSSYRLVVRMHPGVFRERFGDEMLWIFDEERRRGATARVFFDGVRSLIRQRSRIEKTPEPLVAGFVLIDTGLDIAPRRFVEAGVTASLVLAGFMFLLGKTGKPLMVPACLPVVPRSAPRLQAPSRVHALSKDMTNVSRRLDSTQIDNATASAVRIAHAQELSSSAGARYCSAN
jgi:hypothetical protein